MMVLSNGLRARFADRSVTAAKDGAERHIALTMADLCSDLWFFTLFLMYPSVSTTTFNFFMRETFDGDGEGGFTVMRTDRSIETDSPLYLSFSAYALAMLIVYPIGVPVLYCVLLYRSRTELNDLRLMELAQESAFELAKLKVEIAASAEEADMLMREANAAHDAALEEYEALRDQLPTTLRKLTAGYELRTYWFEIFECARKMLLIGLPVFVSPGSSEQLMIGLIICFLSYGMYGAFAPYIDAGDDILAQMAQITIFFSLLASIVTSLDPENSTMATLLPALILVPIALTFVFAVGLTDRLRALTQPDNDGKYSLVGHVVLTIRRESTANIDRLIGVSDAGELRENSSKVLRDRHGVQSRVQAQPESQSQSPQSPQLQRQASDPDQAQSGAMATATETQVTDPCSSGIANLISSSINTRIGSYRAREVPSDAEDPSREGTSREGDKDQGGSSRAGEGLAFEASAVVEVSAMTVGVSDQIRKAGISKAGSSKDGVSMTVHVPARIEEQSASDAPLGKAEGNKPAYRYLSV